MNPTAKLVLVSTSRMNAYTNKESGTKTRRNGDTVHEIRYNFLESSPWDDANIIDGL